jgi:hypothetical protein
MRILLPLALFAPVLLAACANDAPLSPASTPAQPSAPSFAAAASGNPTTERIDLSATFTQFIDCLGEELLVTLRRQAVVHSAEIPSDTPDSLIVLRFHITQTDMGSTAVGLTSGTTYHIHRTLVENLFFRQPTNFVQSSHNHLVLIGEGQAPDLLTNETFHITVNQGGVTVERGETTITCR